MDRRPQRPPRPGGAVNGGGASLASTSRRPVPLRGLLGLQPCVELAFSRPVRSALLRESHLRISRRMLAVMAAKNAPTAERASVCKTLARTERDMQPFGYRSVRYWSKEINGTRTWGRIYLFFNSRPTSRPWPWRPRQWNPVNPCQTGLPGGA